MSETAYKSTTPEAINAFRLWRAECEVIRVKRAGLSDSMGRNLYVSRSAGYPSTYVVGFERFDSDKDGDLLADGSLIVSSRRGVRNGLIVTASIGGDTVAQAVAMLRGAADKLEANPDERRIPLMVDGEEEGAVYVTKYEE